MSHELSVYLPDFYLLLTHEMTVYYQKYVKQIILNHITFKKLASNISSLCSTFIGCESFLKSNSPGILCERDLDESIDSGNFSVRGYLPVISNDSVTHALSCSLC